MEIGELIKSLHYNQMKKTWVLTWNTDYRGFRTPPSITLAILNWRSSQFVPMLTVWNTALSKLSLSLVACSWHKTTILWHSKCSTFHSYNNNAFPLLNWLIVNGSECKSTPPQWNSLLPRQYKEIIIATSYTKSGVASLRLASHMRLFDF